VTSPPVQVADLGGGVVRVTHPLPWALDHVHCYALASPEGWTLVDCGLDTPGTLERWSAALAELGGPVARIVVTHYHPDHLGAAAALSELTRVPELIQGELDARLAEAAWGENSDLHAFETYLRDHGMPAELAAASASAERRSLVRPAAPTRLVVEGDLVAVAGEAFEVLLLPGHADGHIVLLGRETGRLLGGDVLLAEITPNVGRWEDTAPDPLGRYLDTLGRIAALAPTRVYPGHGPVIDESARRAAEIRSHHDERLDATCAALRDGAETTYEVARVIWPGNLSVHEERFALVEAISHLERVCALGWAVETGRGRWSLARGRATDLSTGRTRR
jgi:glyoxylase-like metal-dependent hydrolase (beta-lactamase superfamily II)